ncbi:NAD(P)-dependent oxidoreductase [Limnohabitans sp. Rim8]|jgi:2-hydroxy-3-oxopropionate reductase|uniref:NAD(P)-dependent oxidoreductase n=1 Tax=Limnohabitans sp. Rim8 TaxID=1100718 RepID=UPI0025F639C9|nr:NAD(P)-dependent oxidoreductase [Limnohabitans sp. Rim8]
MKLAFCGLGLMGEPMVKRLLSAGHAVHVWNRTPAKANALIELGAKWCDTPAQAASDVDGVFMCLLNTQAVEDVVFGSEGIVHARNLQWLVDHSSVPPEQTRAWSQRLLLACQADWIDAPVSGGVAGVQTGNLAVMVGGPASRLESASQAMRAYASNITHMGDSGAGQATKLCNQTIVASTVAAIAEAVGLAHRNGIDLNQLAKALQGGWADSKPLQVFVPRMVTPTQPSIGALSTMLKDVDTVMQVAQSTGAPMPVMATVQQQLRAAQAAGLGEAELSALICLVWPEQRPAF